MSNRLEILEKSLVKKNSRLDQLYENHFKDVESANGQPLNDKRNGQATLNRWEKQGYSIKNAKDSIKITENAIIKEKDKIKCVERVKQALPDFISKMIDDGIITQWRKFPDHFFVVGVEKARIKYKKGKLIISYVTKIPNQEQYTIFRTVCLLMDAENDKLNKQEG